MKNVLDDLWEYYQSTDIFEHNEERKKYLEKMASADEKLRALLNKEETELFESFEENLYNVNYITQKEYFIKGVRFATRYMVQFITDPPEA